MGCSQSTPVQEPVAVAPTSNVSAAAPGSATSPQSAAAPVSNISTGSAAAAAPPAPSSTAPSNKTIFAISGVSITEQGTVFYHIEAADGSGSIKKRFNDFKELYAKLPNSSLLPALPAANLGTLFRGKHNPALIKEREQQFAVVLNAIGNNAAFASTDAFQAFLQA